MRHRTQLRQVTILPLLVAVVAVPARGQQPAGGPASAFCALTGSELLAALNGSWTIYQAAGHARAGIMTVPLPAQRPATVTFAFDSLAGMINVQGVNVDGEMDMFPVAPLQQAQADQLIGEKPASKGPEPVCEWGDVPTLIGTNFYLAWESINVILTREWREELCKSIEKKMADPPQYEDPATAAVAAKNRENEKKYHEQYCNKEEKKLPSGADLEMEMTLVLRFTSPNSGAGTLYFEGETNKSRFRASAPVTISR